MEMTAQKVIAEKDHNLAPFGIRAGSLSGGPRSIILCFWPKRIFTIMTPPHSLTSCDTEFWDISRKIHIAELLTYRYKCIPYRYTCKLLTYRYKWGIDGWSVERFGRPYGEMGKAPMGSNVMYANHGASPLDPGFHTGIQSLKARLSSSSLQWELSVITYHTSSQLIRWGWWLSPLRAGETEVWRP